MMATSRCRLPLIQSVRPSQADARSHLSGPNRSLIPLKLAKMHEGVPRRPRRAIGEAHPREVCGLAKELEKAKAKKQRR